VTAANYRLLSVLIFLFFIGCSQILAESQKKNKDISFAIRLFNIGYGTEYGYHTELLPFLIQKKLTDKLALVLAPYLFYENGPHSQGITKYGFTLSMPIYSEKIDDLHMLEGFHYGPGLHYRKIDRYNEFDYLEYREVETSVSGGVIFGYGWTFWEKGFFALEMLAGYGRSYRSAGDYSVSTESIGGIDGFLYLGWELY
jgi:hypothetical protein